uniref:ZP domain-containing protein n=1 Tax=Meloidogyne javanica TaxID=6303 RepID=A0A915M466_MELJA
MQYKQYKPPSRFSHPSSNNLPSFKHPSVAGEAKEPLMVNTLIQVFGPEKGDETETEKQKLSTFVGETSSEQNSPTPPTELLNGQKRVTLTRQLDTLGRTFVPANQTVSTANPKIAIVKAFAASNSSQISEAQLREELGKELEQSVSLILDELGRKDKTTKHPVTSTTQSVPAEELERLEGEEEATTSPKETENSVVSTREATSLQTASTTSVAPLVVFPKTSKEPIEVVPATNVATTAETSEKEKKEEATTVGIKEENNHEENEITSTKETLTEENIVEIKSTTIATAQIYKSAEKKNEAETNLPVATTTNIIEESPTTPTIVKQEETKEENKENSEKPTYPTEEEKGGALLWPWPTNRTFENGVLFAKDFHEESDCYAELDKDSGGGEARLDIGPGKCGLAGSKAFSFLVQCYTPVLPTQKQQLTADLAIQKPLASPVMTKTIELSQTPPRCEYSLRRNTPDGPLLQRATLGQTIYHRWDCSTDPLIVDDPEYEKENLVAYARARVFSLRPESHFLRFSCKLSLCLRQNDGCLGLTPPACPPTNASRIPSHHHPSEKAPAALSQQLLSPQLTVNSDGSKATTSSTPPRLPFHGSAASFGGTGKSSLVDSAWTIGLVLGVSVLLGLFFGLATFLIQSHHRRNRQKRLVQWVG